MLACAKCALAATAAAGCKRRVLTNLEKTMWVTDLKASIWLATLLRTRKWPTNAFRKLCRARGAWWQLEAIAAMML